MSVPDKRSVLQLYRKILETGSRFVDYNFREYSLRRARDQFRTNRQLSDTQQVIDAYRRGVEQYKSLERQVLINSLYSKGDYVIEKTANVHKHTGHTQIRVGDDAVFSATPLTETTALDDRTTMENRKTPDHYASKDDNSPATAIPS